MKSTIKHIFGSTFTLATIVLAASCSDYNPEEFNGNLTKEEYEKISEYTQNFTLRYGKMDPDHDWGFGELAVKGSKGTRGAEPDGNNWVSKGYDNIPPADTKAYEAAVTEIFRDKTKWERYQVVNGIDFTDFFVQQVHKGAADVCTYTSYKNNEGKTSEVYGPDVMNYLSCQKKDGSIEHVNNFNFGEFSEGNWNQNYVDKNGKIQTDGIMLMVGSGTEAFGFSNSNDEGKEYMDAYIVIEYPENSGYYYVGFDYYRRNDGVISDNYYSKLNEVNNKQSEVNNKQNAIDNKHKELNDNANNWDENRKKQVLNEIAQLEKEKAQLEEQLKKLQAEADAYKDRYKNGEKIVDRDYRYDDWIVRITPAKKQSTTPDPTPEIVTTETKRVMCEDLGNTNDFDFNDLVFDVYYTYPEAQPTNITAHITLQAVGGTLPIYLGTTITPENELHSLMGSDTQVPINVGSGKTLAPASFTMPATSTDPDDIQICVGSSSSNTATNVIILPKSVSGSTLAPQKICVPTTVKWLKESQQIEWGYTKFKDWVNSQKQNAFWNDGINQTYLY